MQCLHTIFNIHWSVFVINIEVLEKTKTNSMEAILLKYRVGYVSNMRESLPAQDQTVRCAFRWPSQQRGDEEAIERLLEKKIP